MIIHPLATSLYLPGSVLQPTGMQLRSKKGTQGGRWSSQAMVHYRQGIPKASTVS